MLEELLSIPERRNSIGPELITFFARHGGLPVLHDFIKTFAGTKFVCPGPEFLAGLRADEMAVRRLMEDETIESRIACMMEFGVSYTHLQRVWQAVTGKSLDTPHPTDGRTTIGEAARWIRKHPKLDIDILTMFGVNARQHVDVMGRVAAMRRQRTHDPYAVKEVPENTRTLTEAQEMLLAEVRSRSVMTREEMRAIFRTVPTKTVNVLVQLGYVTMLKSGAIKIARGGK